MDYWWIAGALLAVGSGCGPTVIITEVDGTTTDPPGEDDDPDPPPSVTSVSTSTSTSTSTSPVTTAPPPPTATVGPTTSSTDTTGMPVPLCLDEDLGTVTGAGIAEGSTDDLGNDFNFCGSTGAPGDDYVARWTAPSSGTYHFQLAGSDFDTIIGLFPPECETVNLVCNDDCLGVASSASMTLEEGETIFIVVDGFQGGVGNFVLTIGAGADDCNGGTDTDGTFIATGV